jgi:hypothetical protein
MQCPVALAGMMVEDLLAPGLVVAAAAAAVELQKKQLARLEPATSSWIARLHEERARTSGVVAQLCCSAQQAGLLGSHLVARDRRILQQHLLGRQVVGSTLDLRDLQEGRPGYVSHRELLTQLVDGLVLIPHCCGVAPLVQRHRESAFRPVLFHVGRCHLAVGE